LTKEERDFYRNKAGYPTSNTIPYHDRRVNLLYNEEIIMANVPINLAKWKKKELKRTAQHLEHLFQFEPLS
jgi:hypothetical protein